ncbi:PBP1A family penicillin-binding protein [Aquincola sp. S2]|uniref:Penicillin-binding protein 1A n=1 Tax=Pseudaquabacterium terrae TaxID=2732868 RepID=A0ABX2EM55_9BURK|nr:PBP1A family penicillin-binding protein [Aquabacterium terrae]NRF69594.1 PBP1A family penicillin-binding protein [Aquabacterium terrae]
MNLSLPRFDRRRALRFGLGATLGLGIGAIAALVLAIALVLPQLPALDRVTAYQPRQPLQILSSDGVEIAQFGAERRHYRPIEEIPKLMQDAVLAVEDARFRTHSGIDWIGVTRAVGAALTGGRIHGASTITQQVARNFFLSARRTPERKLKEALLALRIERELSKDQILGLYMNQIYLGQRAYGFAAAAQTYYGKKLEQLSIAEAAMLAGLPQNPSYANPVTNLERAKSRQLTVLLRMRDTGVIDEKQWSAARIEPLKIRSGRDGVLHAEHVAELARRWVVERFGQEVYAQGIRVTTSLRAADQAAAWAALRRGVLEHERKQPWRGPEDQEDLPPEGTPAPELERAAALALKEHHDDEMLRSAIVLAATPREVLLQLASGEQLAITGEGLRWAQPGLQPKARRELAIRRGSVVRAMQQDKRGPKGEVLWQIAQWPEAEGALVSLDPQSGRVRAWVGGFDFTEQNFDHVLQAWRQPGSSFKPFLYSAALEHGVMPATLVNDAELSLPGADGPGSWSPKNSDGQFDGPMRLREALARSKNSVSVRLLQHVGLGPMRDWMQRFGFDAERQPDNLTLALGTGSTTPLQLAQAYAVFANGGWHVTPLLIERITDAKGAVLYEAPPAEPLAEEARVLPARNVFVTNSLLNEVTRSGTAAKAQAQLGRSDLYGKTGTTNDAVDAWFAGFQPSLVAVVWIGYDVPRSLGDRESGGGLALPVWIAYMRQALSGVPAQAQRDPPEGLQRSGSDWLYDEWADGQYVRQIGFELVPEPPMPPASAASGAAPGT